MAEEDTGDNSPARQRSKAITGVTDTESYEVPAVIDPAARALFDALSMGGATSEIADLLIEATDDPEIMNYVQTADGFVTSGELGYGKGLGDLLGGIGYDWRFLSGGASFAGFGFLGSMGKKDRDAKKVERQEIEEIQKQLEGFERLTEDQKLEMTEELAYPGDFDMIIDLFDTGNVLGERMPLH